MPQTVLAQSSKCRAGIALPEFITRWVGSKENVFQGKPISKKKR
jgi:hypothetical protein